MSFTFQILCGLSLGLEDGLVMFVSAFDDGTQEPLVRLRGITVNTIKASSTSCKVR
jgi:hypothetical protein